MNHSILRTLGISAEPVRAPSALKNSSPSLQPFHVQRRTLSMLISMAWIFLAFAGGHLASFDEPYVPFGIAGALAFFWRAAPSRKELIGLLLATAGFALVIHFPASPFWVLKLSACLALLGMAALLILGLRAIWSGSEVRQNALVLLGKALTLILFLLIARQGLSLTGKLDPYTNDLWLFVTDGSLGFQPSFLVGRILVDSRILTVSALLTYFSLPLVMAIVCAWHIPLRATRPPLFILGLLMLSGAGGWLLYHLLPATGPVYVFARDFPWHEPPYTVLPQIVLQKIPAAPAIPRNAFPSLHMGWAILLAWNCRKFGPWARAFMLAYVMLTVVATLGTGQHYFVDLVVSVPYVLTIQSLLSLREPGSWSRRISAALIGFGLLAIWVAMTQYGVRLLLVSPAMPWGLVVLTCFASAWAASWSRGELVTGLHATRAGLAAASHGPLSHKPPECLSSD